MAGPRPNDSYDPNQTVAPTNQPGNNYLSVRSNPDQFGASVGKAVEGLGNAAGQAEESQFKVEMQSQGLANEHAFTMGEQELAIQGGDLWNQYKNKEGLDAVNALPQFIQDYTKLNAKIRASLGNPAAQRGYDQLATRRFFFTVQDANGYASDQRKKAYTKGTIDSAQLSINRAGTFDVASSPGQLDFEKANVIHQMNTAYTAPDFGRYQTVPVTQDKTGLLKFDTSTQQGKIAQADYDNHIDEQLGKFYTNATEIIANDPQHGSYRKAVDFYKEHEKDIPPSSRAALSAKLAGPFHNESNRDYVENRLSAANYDYKQSQGEVDSTNYSSNLGNVKGKVGSFLNPVTPVDGATLAASNLKGGLYDGKTLAQIGQTWTGESPEKATAWAHNVQAASGIDVNAVPDLKNPEVVKSLLRGIALAEKNPKDRAQFNDLTISEGVKNAFFGVKANLAPGRAPTLDGKIHQSEADYLGEHEGELIEEARKSAYDEGYDSIVADQRADRMKGMIAEKRTIQNNEVRSLTDSIYSKVADPNHPVTNMSLLDNSPDQETKQAWARLQFLDPYKASTVQRVVNANAAGKTATFGTDFYTHYNDVLSGKITSIDQLQDYLTGSGDHSPLTPSGLKAINEELKYRETPQGQAFGQKEGQFLAQARRTITGQGFYPGINADELNDNFKKYLLESVPQIQAQRANLIREGKDPSVMFNPDDKENYIGKGIKPPSKADLDKAYFGTFIGGGLLPPKSNPAQVNPGATVPPPIPDISHLTFTSTDDVGKAWQEGRINEAQMRQIIGTKFGGFKPRVPRSTD